MDCLVIAILGEHSRPITTFDDVVELDVLEPVHAVLGVGLGVEILGIEAIGSDPVSHDGEERTDLDGRQRPVRRPDLRLEPTMYSILLTSPL
jgi:hypothetical protein